MFGKKNASRNTIESLIGASTSVVGNVLFQGGLRVDGHVKGNILAAADQPSMLVISEHARVDGEIHVAHAVVNGLINGPVHATELLELQPKARIVGDVRYRALEMHHGAIVDGTLHHEEDESGRPGLKLAASNAPGPTHAPNPAPGVTSGST